MAAGLRIACITAAPASNTFPRTSEHHSLLALKLGPHRVLSCLGFLQLFFLGKRTLDAPQEAGALSVSIRVAHPNGGRRTSSSSLSSSFLPLAFLFTTFF